MQSKDFFSYIKEFPHTLSIFLTFTLENEVIQKIRDISTGRTIIIHDSQQGVNLNENYENRLICLPAIMEKRVANCFHPKLAILKGEDKIRILVGSMNLTRSSFSSRQELCLQKDFYFGDQVYGQIINFLSLLHYPKSVNLNFINELIPQQSNLDQQQTENIQFIYNDDKFSIYDKFIQEVKKQNTKPILKIASPFLNKDLPEKFDELIDKLDPQIIELYTRTFNKIPDKLKSIDKQVKIFEPDKKYSRFGFHLKLISVDYGDQLLLFIGSANFTKQGFFSSLSEYGNQECGIIIQLNDPDEIKQVNDWFNKGWKKPCLPEEWQEKDEADDEFDDYSLEPYAIALRTGKVVNVEIFVPDNDNHISIIINSKKYDAVRNSDGLFPLSLKNISDKTENLSIKIKNYDTIKIKIFNPVEFDKWKGYDGDSLFSYIDSPLESINIDELSSSVNNLGIKTGNGNYSIIEPPKLEQFYQNVKREYESIIRKKTLTKSHLSELNQKLGNIKDGTGIYAIMQFIKAFTFLENKYKLDLNDFKEICRTRIKDCLNEIETDENKFKRFLNRWIKISAN